VGQPVLEFLSVTKRFGSVSAVNGVTFTVEPGEFFTLLGPSGCGKTTTMRLVAGLEAPDEGEILLNGRCIASQAQGVFLPPDKRKMGMVFQSYAIWPHLTVFENVAFPLRVRGEPSHVIRRRVGEALELVGLEGLEERGATQLSGGQQQRVALARAIVYTPSLLLLDEPLSNLDAKLREQMRSELRALQRRLGLSVLYVTHDQTEAMTLSDRIAVVHQGRFEQVGTPIEVYERPATAFVGDFLGRTVMLEGLVRREARSVELLDGAGQLALRDNLCLTFAEGEKVRILSRPEEIEISPHGEMASNQLAAEIEDVSYLGDHLEYRVAVGAHSFVLSAGKRIRYQIGAKVLLTFDAESLTVVSR
jgi:ABC-type Fe3+/spermidine/putrescine transport system ATPase subunit